MGFFFIAEVSQKPWKATRVELIIQKREREYCEKLHVIVFDAYIPLCDLYLGYEELRVIKNHHSTANEESARTHTHK